MTELSIVIVNWNTAALLRDCLRALHATTPFQKEVIVVDNGSMDDSVNMVRSEFPGVYLIALEGNEGFSRANNAGLAETTGDLVLLLNPDTEVRPGSLESLANFMHLHPSVGIAGPTLLNPDGTHQPSAYPFPGLWIEFLRQTMLYRLWPSREQARMSQDVTQEVDAVTGAALCMRRACFEEIGPLDPGIFMFYEDIDWCLRAHQAGWEVWHVQNEGIMHVKAAASSRFARAATILESQRSAIFYFAKHQGRRAVVGLRLIALFGAPIRLLRAAMEWALGIERRERRQRMAAYAAIWRWGATGRGLS